MAAIFSPGSFFLSLASQARHYQSMTTGIVDSWGEEGGEGWRSGEGTRLPPLWLSFDPRMRCHMWVEYAVGSRPCSKRFFQISGYSGFPLS